MLKAAKPKVAAKPKAKGKPAKPVENGQDENVEKPAEPSQRKTPKAKKNKGKK